MRGTGLALCLIAGFLSGACATPVPEGHSLTYSVGGCSEESRSTGTATEGEVQITGKGDTIHVSHGLTYVCCAELVLIVQQQGNRIRLLESNVGEICRCLCDYDVEADVSGLEPGVYDVQLWGVEY